MITEPTSSVFILRRDRERGWMTALVWHPRLECWLPAGGHVEENETAAQCGIREALEFPVSVLKFQAQFWWRGRAESRTSGWHESIGNAKFGAEMTIHLGTAAHCGLVRM